MNSVKGYTVRMLKDVYRHELKYLISEREADILKMRLKERLGTDIHAHDGSYFIRSLYFDDIWESAYFEKQAGTCIRKKYRIRIYNYSDDFISLECKEKRGSYIQKRSAVISREELDKIEKGEYAFLMDRQEQVLKEFYIACTAEGLRPSVLVDYDRTPFVYDPGTVRITFDEHVRSGFAGSDIFDRGIPVFEVLEEGKLILEVKYTEYLPDAVRDLLETGAAVSTAASKYVMCSDAMRDVRGLWRAV